VTTLGAIEADMGPIDALIYNAGNGVWKKYDEITVDQVFVPRLCVSL
jgi:short-subunit dehydrogenase